MEHMKTGETFSFLGYRIIIKAGCLCQQFTEMLLGCGDIHQFDHVYMNTHFTLPILRDTLMNTWAETHTKYSYRSVTFTNNEGHWIT